MDDRSDVMVKARISDKCSISVLRQPNGTNCLTYRGGGGGGTWDFANPTQATIPTARIIHPNMSYLRSLLFFFFEDACNRKEKIKPKLQKGQAIKKTKCKAV